MTDHHVTLELIGDAAMFKAREFVVRDARYPSKCDTNIGPGVHAMLLRISGRHRTWLNSTAAAQTRRKEKLDDRRYLTLRIDPDLNMISGDFFGDAHRKDWLHSFQSQALFHVECPSDWDREAWGKTGWSLLAICDLKSHDQGSDRSQILALALRIGAGERIAAIRAVATNGKAESLWDLSKTEADTTRYSEHLRGLKPLHILDKTAAGDHQLRSVIEQALGDGGAHVLSELRDANTGISWKKSDASWIESQADGAPFGILTPYQWTDDPRRFAILFSSLETTSYGTVLELNKDETPLAKVRFGAAIFVPAIIRSVLRRHGTEDWESHLNDIARVVRRTYVHEIGHLLNLPHTWQRGQFDVPPMASGPAERSWMAYGSRFPLGDFMNTSRRRLAKGDPEKERVLLLEDAARSQSGPLTEPQFTVEERRWIRHASFDHVSPGGPYFTARANRKPELEPPSGTHRAKLSITLWDGTKSDGRDGLEFVFANGVAQDRFYRQLVFGEVCLDVASDFAEKHPCHVAFQSPMLSLLLRDEPEDASDRYVPQSVHEVPVAAIPTDWHTVGPSGSEGAIDLAYHFHEHVQRPSSHSTQGSENRIQFRRLFPVFNPSAFTDRFRRQDRRRRYTIQAVARPLGAKPIFSDPIRLRFGGRPKFYSAQELEILTDADLPVFLELAAYFGQGIQLASLARPDRHGFQPPKPAFPDLMAKISALPGDGRLSPRFFQLLRRLTEIQSYKFGDGPAPTPTCEDDPLWHILEEHAQDDDNILDVLRARPTQDDRIGD